MQYTSILNETNRYHENGHSSGLDLTIGYLICHFIYLKRETNTTQDKSKIKLTIFQQIPLKTATSSCRNSFPPHKVNI